MHGSNTVLMLAGMALSVADFASAQSSTFDGMSPAVTHTTSIGAYYSRGKYGDAYAETDTRIRYLPVAHEVKRGLSLIHI